MHPFQFLMIVLLGFDFTAFVYLVSLVFAFVLPTNYVAPSIIMYGITGLNIFSNIFRKFLTKLNAFNAHFFFIKLIFFSDISVHKNLKMKLNHQFTVVICNISKIFWF